MLEKNREIPAAETSGETVATSYQRALSRTNFLSSKERDEILIREILQETGERFVPIEDSHIRVIDIQRSIRSGYHWERIISEIYKDINNKITNLQNRIEEISEALRDTIKIHNASIYELNNPKYSITSPIQIVIIEDEDEIVARIPELNLYATGDTDTEAIYELKLEIIELYEELSSTDNKLGPLPKSWLNTLNRLIVINNEQT